MSDYYYDGDFTIATPVGPVRTEQPFEWEPDCLVFRQEFWQLADNYSPLALGTTPAAGGMTPAVAFKGGQKGNKGTAGKGPYLVRETERLEVGIAGVVKWDRVWAHVPAPHYEFPAYNYQAQRYEVIKLPWSGTTDIYGRFQGVYKTFNNIAEWTEPLQATVEFSYRLIPPGTKDFLKKEKALIPYRVIKFSDTNGKEFLYIVGTKGVAEATSAKRWMGDIFEIRNVYVKPYLV